MREGAAVPVGTDSSKFPGAPEQGAAWTLREAHKAGLEGVFFRSALELSPTLDPGELRAVVALADELGMYVEVGTAKVNPFAAPEAPEVRELGDGDYLRGLEKLIVACAQAGVRELWSATANYKFALPGRLGCDRFRTDVTWSEQLEATAKVLARLGPLLRDLGVHLNLETHEEITTFELVRLIEDAGPDAFGITFDTANVLLRCEDPVAAAHRVAPYVRQTHVRDAALLLTPDGIRRFLLPCGQGVIDWAALLRPLVAHAPRLTLSIEGVMGRRFPLPLSIYDPVWHDGHPDLTTRDLAELVRLADAYGRDAAAGLRPGYARLSEPVPVEERLAFVTDSASHLRAVLATLA
ncbi:sugar phosphate isomerase/epimerase family protein [Actinocorallia sp. A-T 12471]|uniref:sugar phosphate isomerase/epimerase family protein n=1 Tax=Actinocorallia sp. A-T 12471 TaxID=3089813 RepID=UPI0029CDA391|nr:sugar phosphate isomerase/epimerase family protein [Actinocorallia sp. A-T 12471]MDX6740806.1 sugar phosphate isomerase/epimerase family protein [Actinocorallia sp. A-T 12471]